MIDGANKLLSSANRTYICCPMTTALATMFPVDTFTACGIAGIEVQRFNELVHFNKYSAAPATAPGRKRMFDEEDVVALYLYVQWRGLGFDTTTAGRWAAIVKAAMVGASAAKVDDRQIAFQIGLDGSITVGMATATSPTLFGITVALANVRAIVAQKLEERAVTP